jgi:hypothetical protein
MNNFLIEQEKHLYAYSDTDSEASNSNEAVTKTAPVHPVSSINIYTSAVAIFPTQGRHNTPSGMRQERIRATPVWRKSGPRYDPVFVNFDSEQLGMRAHGIARVLRFLSVQTSDNRKIPCALVQWWSVLGTEPDELTGMWLVEPDFDGNGAPIMSIIHLKSIVRAAHLLPAFGSTYRTPANFPVSSTLNKFSAYYVNKYADHHAFSIAY